MKVLFFRWLYIGFLLSLLWIGNVYAWPEERACFDILKSRVNITFGVDLTHVYNGYSDIDISTYAKFQNKKYKPGSSGGFFNSQRNNIGTIILPNNYITTQYVPLGSSTDFKFPINNNGSLIGDEFTVFRNQMVYTHHNIFDGWSFLSCGYLKITPYGSYTFYDLDPSNYFTNIIDGGWFEIDYSTEVPLNTTSTGHFIVGKSVVQWATKLGFGSATRLEKLFKVEILNVIYDNGSSYFNEYETYPLQVDAMTNADASTTAWSLQQDFAARVINSTCLSFAHPTNASLPAFCTWNYQSLSSGVRTARWFALNTAIPDFSGSEDFFTRIFSLVIPQVSAALEPDELKDVQSRVDTTTDGIGNTIMIDSNFDYFQYKKIKSLPSERLQEYIFAATNYQYDQELQNQIASGTSLDEQSKIFYDCGIPYQDRVTLIKKWIDGIDIAHFSLDSIEYPDPKIGDCILPFPDKRHADQIIPWSFKTNQQYAQYLIDIKSSPVNPRITELKKKMQELEKLYAQEIDIANITTASGDVITWKKLLSEASTKYEPQIEKIQNEMYDILNPGAKNAKRWEIKDINPKNQYLSYILVVFWLILCFIVVFIVRNSKAKKPSGT